MNSTYRFGPLVYHVCGQADTHALLVPFRVPDRECERATTVQLIHRSGPFGDSNQVRVRTDGGYHTILGPGFGAHLRPFSRAEDVVVEAWLDRRCLPGFALMSLLGALVVYDAVRQDMFVLHAGGVFVHAGVALLAGASGVGKSTAVRRVQDRAFCYNSVLVSPRFGICWPLPFTGKDDPAVPAVDGKPLAMVAELVRGTRSHLEWSDHNLATKALMAHVVVHTGDPAALNAVVAAVNCFRQVPLAIIEIDGVTSVVDLIDSSLQTVRV